MASKWENTEAKMLELPTHYQRTTENQTLDPLKKDAENDV
jgi:hypothetical protein